MKKKEMKKQGGNWVLLNKKRKILYRSDSVADVYRKGQEYPEGSVIIEQRFEPGTCFF
ncbi:MAG TPA: hypothetical protein VMY59_10210 [Candidatus Thermoplasmatota archaeon]|nr:hypothetical protein [Candidatus Thermoplasmatota archaeon]